MAENSLTLELEGKKVLFMGNEAFARGAIEAGVKLAAGYPGTPSSEIMEAIGSVAQEAGIYAEWSVNEKVAFEVAYAAAVAGVRSVVTFKSVGLNVAADSLMVANSAGVEGGFVILTADDPSGHSSQNEQDCRCFAKFAEVPVLEPSDPQEAKNAMLAAFELSERSKLPVIVRSATRLSHVRGNVELGPIASNQPAAHVPEEKVFTGFPCVAHHVEHHHRLNSIADIVNQFPLNRLEAKGGEKIGIIASGVGYAYAKEALQMLQMEGDVALLKIGIAYPLPQQLIANFLKQYRRVLVLEDGFPFLEEEIKKLCYDQKIAADILGKLSGHLPLEGELSPELTAQTVNIVIGGTSESPWQTKELAEIAASLPEAPARPLSLCAGCAHMGMWYAMKKATKGGKKDIRKGAVVCGDIGCYGLGLFHPYNMFNTHVCMGASIGVANGMSKLNLDKPVFAYLGEGTFFHSGLSALQNAVFNQAKLVVLVQDNHSTAMTGHQENPGVGRNLAGNAVPQVKVERIAEAMGVPYVKVVDPYNVSEVTDSIKEALQVDGPAVIVGRRKCAELAKREAKRKKVQIVPPTIEDSCNGCKLCINQLHCPALIWHDELKKVAIDPLLCVSCSLCAQVCPRESIVGGEGIAHVS